jgi:ATP-binding cassette, subfamily B, bacterial
MLVPDPEDRDAAVREGAVATVRRGLALSPELRVGLLATLLLAVVSTAGRVVVPVLVQQVLDRGVDVTTGAVDLDVVLQLIGLGAVAVVVTALATAAMNVRLAVVTERALSRLRARTFAHVHDLSALHQAAEQRGVLVARVTTDIDQISRFVQWAGLQLIVNTGQAALALVVMLVLSWRLALVVVVAVPVIALVVRLFQARLDRAYLTVRVQLGRVLGRLAEVVVGAQVIRAYGAEARTQARLADAVAAHRHAAVRAGWQSAAFSATGEVLSSLVLAGVLVVGSALAVGGTVTVGEVVAFLFLAQLFVEPVQAFGEAVNEAQSAVAGWRRVLEVLDVEPDVADPGAGGVDLPPGALGLAVRGVAFAYPGRDGEPPAPVLHDVDLDIAPRSRVAVVGETGSGKTTFAKLLVRLMDPTEGEVRLGPAGADGVPLSQVRFASLRDRVVMVPQDGLLFAGTLADNVRMGRAGATDADVEAALSALGLDDWVATLPDGTATPVGERGASLSAGERQLVALARAQLADPDVLVLDEATSAVDPATDVRLQRALVGLAAGRTTVTIAHRLSTAEQADRILVFDDGRVVEDGRHDQLVAAGGRYAALHAAWTAGTAGAPAAG